jgi:phosphoglycolate phosphatase
MLPVGVLWGFRTREELAQHGARVLLASPDQLLPLLDGGGAA